MCCKLRISKPLVNLIIQCCCSYYDLAKAEPPSLYSMETHEIVDKLESIVTETFPETSSGELENLSVSDLVVKYKVRLSIIIIISTQ